MQRIHAIGLCLLAISWPRGCTKTAPPPPPPPTVTVAQPVQRELVEYRHYTGRIEAVDTVEVRTRVRGFLKKIHFQEGAEVKQGDLLYEIDPRTFEADLARAEGELKRLRAQAELASEEAQRARRLRAGRAISEEEFDQRLSASKSAQASLAQAEAAVRSAALELSFTKIRAPIAGRVGRTRVTEGNLVGSGEPTLLTTIVRQEPMYVYFDAPERDFLEYHKRIREQGLARATDLKIPVFVGLVNEKGYPRKGTIDFRDNRIDAGTGTIRLRGELPNPDRALIPGLFARIRVPFGKPTARLLVPEAALQTDQRGRYLLVVRPDNTVEYRPVSTGTIVGDQIVIEKGIKPDDWVIINGLQRARPGATVDPQPGKTQTNGQ